jgi:hypothetical protein
MRKKRDPETAPERDERLERHARLRTDEASAEDKAIDAAIRRSIKLHGA